MERTMRIDCAGGTLISPKKLETVGRSWTGQADRIISQHSIASQNVWKQTGESLSSCYLGMELPEEWLCSLNGMVLKVKHVILGRLPKFVMNELFGLLTRMVMNDVGESTLKIDRERVEVDSNDKMNVR